MSKFINNIISVASNKVLEIAITQTVTPAECAYQLVISTMQVVAREISGSCVCHRLKDTIGDEVFYGIIESDEVVIHDHRCPEGVAAWILARAKDSK